MAQLAIYLDRELAMKLDRASRKDGMSRSAWVRKALEAQLANRFPETFFSVLGAWEDERDTEEILRDIRMGTQHQSREPVE